MKKNSKKKKKNNTKKMGIYGKIHIRVSEPLLFAILTACMTCSKQLPFKKVDPVTIPVTVTDTYDASDTIADDSDMPMPN